MASSLKTDGFAARDCSGSRRLYAALLLIALFAIASSGLAAEAASTAGLEKAGLVAPRSVVLTPARRRVTKPVTVILQNRAEQPAVIGDAATLAALVTLEVKSLGAAPNPRSTLVPPVKFPVTVAPGRKVAVVFNVTFDQIDPTTKANGFSYLAKVHHAATALFGAEPSAVTERDTTTSALADATMTNVAATPALERLIFAEAIRSTSVSAAGPSNGATVTASPTHVALKKDKSESEQITFTAKWPGKSFFVSGWESTPADPTADPIFANSQSPTVKARWKNPGEYTVTAYLIQLTSSGFEQAEPSVQIQVIKVEFQDENGADPSGMKIGVSTGTDRSRSLKAIVTPASQTQNVTVKVSQGASSLSVKDVNPGSGTITFKAEGIGKTGSKSAGDCTIEADVDGKPAATADVTVVIPQNFTQTAGAFESRNVQANSGTSPALPAVPGPFAAATETFYSYPVTITVTDQFGATVGDAKLFGGAPISEAFIVKSTTFAPTPINLTLKADSTYVDPVGVQIWQNWPAAPQWGIYNPAYSPHATPDFALPKVKQAQSKTDVFQIVVDGFRLTPTVTRTLTLTTAGTITLTQTP